VSQHWEKTPGKTGGCLTPYTGQLDMLTPADLAYFDGHYEIPFAHRFIQRGMDGSRYALPIFAPNGDTRGYVLRKGWAGSPLDGWSFGDKKALTYMHKAAPVQSSYIATGQPTRPLVLVEDQLSAIKLFTDGYNAVALLGVPNGGNIGADRVREIARIQAGEVVVALDADATTNALEFVRKYGMAFRKIRVAILDRDLKDTPKRQFREVLGT